MRRNRLSWGSLVSAAALAAMLGWVAPAQAADFGIYFNYHSGSGDCHSRRVYKTRKTYYRPSYSSYHPSRSAQHYTRSWSRVPTRAYRYQRATPTPARYDYYRSEPARTYRHYQRTSCDQPRSRTVYYGEPTYRRTTYRHTTRSYYPAEARRSYRRYATHRYHYPRSYSYTRDAGRRGSVTIYYGN